MKMRRQRVLFGGEILWASILRPTGWQHKGGRQPALYRFHYLSYDFSVIYGSSCTNVYSPQPM
jgi:hypothetical protein